MVCNLLFFSSTVGMVEKAPSGFCPILCNGYLLLQFYFNFIAVSLVHILYIISIYLPIKMIMFVIARPTCVECYHIPPAGNVCC